MKRTSAFRVGIPLLTLVVASSSAAQDCVRPPAGLGGTPVDGAGFAPGFIHEALSFDGVEIISGANLLNDSECERGQLNHFSCFRQQRLVAPHRFSSEASLEVTGPRG